MSATPCSASLVQACSASVPTSCRQARKSMAYPQSASARTVDQGVLALICASISSASLRACNSSSSCCSLARRSGCCSGGARLVSCTMWLSSPLRFLTPHVSALLLHTSAAHGADHVASAAGRTMPHRAQEHESGQDLCPTRFVEGAG